MSTLFLPIAPTLMAITTTLVSLAKTNSSSTHSNFSSSKAIVQDVRTMKSGQTHDENEAKLNTDQSGTENMPLNVWRRSGDSDGEDDWINDPISMQLVTSPLPKVSNATASGAHMDLDIEIDIQLLPTNYYDMTTVSFLPACLTSSHHLP